MFKGSSYTDYYENLFSCVEKLGPNVTPPTRKSVNKFIPMVNEQEVIDIVMKWINKLNEKKEKIPEERTTIK